MKIAQVKPLTIYILSGMFALICVLRHMVFVKAWDQSIYNMAAKMSDSEIWLRFWWALTMVGDGYFVYTVVGILAIIFLIRFFSYKAIAYIILLFILYFSNLVLKEFFQLPRPESLASFYPQPKSFTFPSGHAVNGVVLFYFVPIFAKAVLLKQKIMTEHFSVYLFKIIMILGIALSRVALGVHWFSDVLGGIFWGFVICDIALYVYQHWLRADSSF